MTRERDVACALSEERKGELDQAHKTLGEQFRKRRDLRDVYCQLEAQRNRLKAENEALQLTLQVSILTMYAFVAYLIVIRRTLAMFSSATRIPSRCIRAVRSRRPP